MARKKSAEELEDEEGGMEPMDYGEEPDFSDPEDFVEDVTDEVSRKCDFESNFQPGQVLPIIQPSWLWIRIHCLRIRIQ